MQFPSLQLVVDYNGADPGGFSTLTYEPVYNTGRQHYARTSGTATRPARASGARRRSSRASSTSIRPSCSNGGAKLLTAYTAADRASSCNAVYINQGSGNPGLESAVDLITTPSTTYDFELTKPVIVPPITDPPTTEPTTPTTHPGTPGEHGGGHWGDGQPGHGNGRPRRRLGRRPRERPGRRPLRLRLIRP